MNKFFVYKTIPKFQLEELLACEPKLKKYIPLDKPFTIRVMPDIYQCFVHTVISQQLSSAAVDAIWNKLIFSFKKINPKILSKATTEQLNAVGLSPQKISLIKKVSYDIIDRKLNFVKMTKWTYEEIYNRFIKYKYIGKWTIDILLLFGYGRSDMLLLTDYGVSRGLKYLYNVGEITKQLIKQIQKQIPQNLWTVFTLCMWFISNSVKEN